MIKEDNRNQGREHTSNRHKILYQNLKYQSSQCRCLDTAIQVDNSQDNTPLLELSNPIAEVVHKKCKMIEVQDKDIKIAVML